MIDSSSQEPYLANAPPRCLTRPRENLDDAKSREDRGPRRAMWPLRANFQHWALKLLTSRSGNAG